jgi:two-component sensor histidine kinase
MALTHRSQSTRPQALTALRDIARAINAAWDLDSTLDLIARKTTEVMRVDSCTIYLLDPDGEMLRLRASTGLARRAIGRAILRVGEGMTGHAVQINQPVYARDAPNHPRFKRVDEAEETNYQSLLAVSMQMDAQTIGALNVQTTEPHNFSHDEIEILLLIGDLAAGALVKARLHDQQRRQIEEMRTLARENERLMTNTAVIREMHHRIKNNLQTVAMLMQLQIPDAEALDTRDVLETNIHRIRSIAAVHEVLSEKGFRLVDVKDVLLRITRATAAAMTLPQQTIAIEVYGESLPLPSREATALALAVNELVQNGLDHAFVGKKNGRIEISLGRSAEERIVLVRDDGVGLPPDYERGLGLEIVHTLVKDDLHGRIKFHPRPNGGTEVSIRIPRTTEQEEAGDADFDR